MKFRIRQLGGGISDVQVEIDGALVDLGWMNAKERQEMAGVLRGAADDLAPEQNKEEQS